MKGRIIFLGMFFLLISNSISAQNKVLPKSIISTTASIKKYHDKKELQGMQKGELLELYIERIKVLVKTLPYVALATRPGVTMIDLGIPDDQKNRDALEDQAKITTEFLEATVQFQRSMLPYSDKGNIVNSILFYENTLKSLHEFEDL